MAKKSISKTCNPKEKLEQTYVLALQEIHRVLNRKAPVTEYTKIAILFLHNYSKIKSAEVREKALKLFEEKGIPMLN